MRFGILALGLVTPLIGATAMLLTIAAGERGRQSLFAYEAPRNSAEAAALGNAAAVVGFLEAGEDPQQTYPVRPEAISSSVPRATTVEAAVLSRRVEMVQLLDHAGAVRDPALRQELACLARDIEQQGIADALMPGAVCERGAALARWQERLRQGG
jgi:hypothetical protein